MTGKDAAAQFPTRHIRISGLQRELARIVDALSLHESRDADAIMQRIAREHASVGRIIEADGIAHEQLTEATAHAVGWFAHFAQRDAFEAYVDAVDRARAAYERVIDKQPGGRLPARVTFRPSRVICRTSSDERGTHIELPAPMVCFSDEQFNELAQHTIAGARNRQHVETALTQDHYRALHQKLSAVADAFDQAAGSAVHLRDVFDRVNAAYFDGRMSPPRLTWSGQLTRRKFGHYEHIADTVMISTTLDDAQLDPLIIDFVMYHELLHKKHGIRWRGGRQYAHTRAFRADERRFRDYAQAEAALTRLASRQR